MQVSSKMIWVAWAGEFGRECAAVQERKTRTEVCSPRMNGSLYLICRF